LSFDLEIFVDGACKGNPGKAGIGVVMLKDDEKVGEISRAIGDATNNIAEYSALICALEQAKERNAKRIKIYTDSELVHNQVTGKYKVKNEKLIDLFNRSNELAKDFEYVEIKHVPREQNKDADKLASDSLKTKQVKMVAPLFQSSEEESPSSKG